MRSMTGYGRGECLSEATRFSVELHSVNRKQIDISLSLPRSLQSLEPKIREHLQPHISRGRLNVTIALHSTQEGASSVIDFAQAKLVADAMQQLKSRLSLAGEVTLDAVLRAPGVLGAPAHEASPESAWPHIQKALNQALESLLQMRELEGRHLIADLRLRLSQIGEWIRQIRDRAPLLSDLYRAQLQERIHAAGLSVPIEEDRLTREVLLFADRSDVTEELTRIESHMAQFETLLAKSEPIGRTLEFLTQEFARELNTLAVKSCDASISHWIVSCKAELEKIREQIQNIE